MLAKNRHIIFISSGGVILYYANVKIYILKFLVVPSAPPKLKWTWTQTGPFYTWYWNTFPLQLDWKLIILHIIHLPYLHASCFFFRFCCFFFSINPFILSVHCDPYINDSLLSRQKLRELKNNLKKYFQIHIFPSLYNATQVSSINGSLILYNHTLWIKIKYIYKLQTLCWHHISPK